MRRKDAPPQKKSEKVLARALFFFVRIAVKKMRHGSAGRSRGVSFPKSINKHKELVHPLTGD